MKIRSKISRIIIFSFLGLTFLGGLWLSTQSTSLFPKASAVLSDYMPGGSLTAPAPLLPVPVTPPSAPFKPTQPTNPGDFTFPDGSTLSGSVPSTVAQDTTQSTPQKQDIDFGKLASLLVSIFTPLIAILVKYIGMLMGTDVILGKFGNPDAVNFSEILHTVWLIMRDLVNYIFILVLLAIAFMSVFSAAQAGENTFEIKKLLPKFIISVVAVNFTWFGAQVVLDVANVATNIVYAIPKTLIGSQNFKDMTCQEAPRTKEVNGHFFQSPSPELDLESCFPVAIFIKNQTVLGKTKTPTTIGDPEPVNGTSTAFNTTTPTSSTTPDLIANTGNINIFTADATGQLAEDAKEARIALTNTGGATAQSAAGAAVSGISSAASGAAAISSTTPTTTESDADLKAKIDDFVKNNPDARYKQDYGKFLILWGNFNWERFQSNAIASLFAYNILQIQNLPRSVKETLDKNPDIEDLIVNSGFALLFMIVILIAFLVLGVVLFERIPVIWMNIILSPMLALMYAIKDFGFDLGSLDDKGIGIKAFMKFAFLPAYVGIPLTVGYVLIMAGMSLTKKVVDYSLVFETELINGVQTIQHMLWLAITVAIIWSSSTLAEGISNYTKPLVEGIRSTAKSVGGFVAKLPLYAEFIPIPRTGKGGEAEPFSLKSLLYGMHNFTSSFEENAQKQGHGLFAPPNLDISIKNAITTKPDADLKKGLEIIDKQAKNHIDLEHMALSPEVRSPEFRKAFGLESVSEPTADHLRKILETIKASPRSTLLTEFQFARELANGTPPATPPAAPGNGTPTPPPTTTTASPSTTPPATTSSATPPHTEPAASPPAAPAATGGAPAEDTDPAHHHG